MFTLLLLSSPLVCLGLGAFQRSAVDPPRSALQWLSIIWKQHCNVNLSEIHVECEVHELFGEIPNGEDKHGDTNGDWNPTWNNPRQYVGIHFGIDLFFTPTYHSWGGPSCHSRLGSCWGWRRCSPSLTGSPPLSASTSGWRISTIRWWWSLLLTVGFGCFWDGRGDPAMTKVSLSFWVILTIVRWTIVIRW